MHYLCMPKSWRAKQSCCGAQASPCYSTPLSRLPLPNINILIICDMKWSLCAWRTTRWCWLPARSNLMCVPFMCCSIQFILNDVHITKPQAVPRCSQRLHSDHVYAQLLKACIIVRKTYISSHLSHQTGCGDAYPTQHQRIEITTHCVYTRHGYKYLKQLLINSPLSCSHPLWDYCQIHLQ